MSLQFLPVEARDCGDEPIGSPGLSNLSSTFDGVPMRAIIVGSGILFGVLGIAVPLGLAIGLKKRIGFLAR